MQGLSCLQAHQEAEHLQPIQRALQELGEYQGAVIMVSHDEGAVSALKPERVILLPDGDEDIWKDEYFDLVSIDQKKYLGINLLAINFGSCDKFLAWSNL